MRMSNLVYISGVLQRSGTNFLSKSLRFHPEIKYSVHPSEDHLLRNIHLLNEYVESTAGYWSEIWKGMDKKVSSEKLRDSFQKSLTDYLIGEDKEQKYILTKTPSTEGIIEGMRFLPPSTKIIFLVRDGRNVIQSGVDSFKWDYIQAMNNWNESMRRIMEAKRKYNDRVLVLHYEKLNEDLKGEMIHLLNFLKLDIVTYPFEQAIKSSKVITGSSTNKNDKGKVDWSNHKQKTDGFNPNNRFDNWGNRLKRSYNKICGEMAKEFGYDIFENTGFFIGF